MKNWITSKIADVAGVSPRVAVVLIHLARLGTVVGHPLPAPRRAITAG